MMELCHITAGYGGPPVLRNVSLVFEPGKVTVLAAASLQGAFEEIEKTVEKDNPGLDVTFDFQGSRNGER